MSSDRTRGHSSALAVRHEYKLGDAPVDVFDLIVQKEVGLVRRDFGEDAGGAVYVNRLQTEAIVVNSFYPDHYQRWVAARALGHREMHRPTGNRGAVFYVGGPKDPDNETQEQGEAEMFAWSLLVPMPAVEDDLIRRHRTRGILPWDIMELSARYGVGYGNMARVACVYNPLAGEDDYKRLMDGYQTMLTWRYGGDWESPSQDEIRLSLEEMGWISSLLRADLVEAELVADSLRIDPEKAKLLGALGEGLAEIPEERRAPDDLEEQALCDYPFLCEEWDTEENGPVGDESAASRRRVSWVCHDNPDHRWRARVVSRVRGAECPFCPGPEWGADRLRSFLSRFHRDLMVMPTSRLERWFEGTDLMDDDRIVGFMYAYMRKQVPDETVRAFMAGDDTVLSQYRAEESDDE